MGRWSPDLINDNVSPRRFPQRHHRSNPMPSAGRAPPSPVACGAWPVLRHVRSRAGWTRYAHFEFSACDLAPSSDSVKRIHPRAQATTPGPEEPGAVTLHPETGWSLEVSINVRKDRQNLARISMICEPIAWREDRGKRYQLTLSTAHVMALISLARDDHVHRLSRPAGTTLRSTPSGNSLLLEHFHHFQMKALPSGAAMAVAGRQQSPRFFGALSLDAPLLDARHLERGMEQGLLFHDGSCRHGDLGRFP